MTVAHFILCNVPLRKKTNTASEILPTSQQKNHLCHLTKFDKMCDMFYDAGVHNCKHVKTKGEFCFISVYLLPFDCHVQVRSTDSHLCMWHHPLSRLHDNKSRLTFINKTMIMYITGICCCTNNWELTVQIMNGQGPACRP